MKAWGSALGREVGIGAALALGAMLAGCSAQVSGDSGDAGDPGDLGGGAASPTAGAPGEAPPCRARFDDAPLAIVPLGDSITQGFWTHLSYRYFLWERLDQAGVPFDLIGSLQMPWGGTRDYPDPRFDPDHEGHWGIRAQDVAERLSGWSWQRAPDIVLMHLGTNDTERYMPPPIDETDIERSVAAIGDVIAQLRERNPNVRVGVAKLLPISLQPERHRLIELFNDGVAVLLPQLSSSESPLTLVDQATGMAVDTHTYDNVHPNEAGEREMARRWHLYIEQLLDDPDLCPR